MIPITIAEIAELAGGTVTEGTDPADVVTAPASADSRTVIPGGLFVALPGEHRDGHDFVAAATQAGAVVSLTSRPVDGSPCVVVPEPLAALGKLARWVIDQLPDLAVVALTGSQGKTSTKDLLAQLLVDAGPTIAPQNSFNNEIGHPLTALRADSDTRFLVSEMGATAIGDIRYLCEITPPRIGLVLNVGMAHLGGFGSRDNIAQAKGELVEALGPDGTAVLNADDPRVAAMASRTQASVLTFGESDSADVRATDIEVDDAGRPGFTLHIAGEQHRIRLGLLGEHQVGNALAAAAVAYAVQIPPARIAELLRTAKPLSKWRMEITERPDGVTVINDAYNSNPDSARAALKTFTTLARQRQGRTWAVLGEMRELGAASASAHETVGRLAVELAVDRVVAVGTATQPIHQAVREHHQAGGTESVYVDTKQDALDLLRAELRPGDMVLLKTSRTIGFEEIAAALLADEPAGVEGAAG